eukprot:Tbor_TRINITY_DN3024_c0_g1::TRINITY_DN3024_c0_g1_i1::g.17380::m.17380/K17609/NXN; nucleoredoxin
MQAILGTTTLQTKNGEVSIDTLNGKYVLIYFSAHWCPPCKQFTPILAEFYTKHHESKNFEIIYVSSDRTETEFEGYYASQPWTAIRFSDQAAKMQISKLFSVSGIPTLIVLDPQGNVITSNGRGMVMGDKDAAKFPWVN